jgi:hypothetical protein
MVVLDAFILVAFIKLLLVTRSPGLCTGLYTAAAVVTMLISLAGGNTTLIGGVLYVLAGGLLAWAYFLSLERIDPWTGTWWTIAVSGPFIITLVQMLFH